MTTKHTRTTKHAAGKQAHPNDRKRLLAADQIDAWSTAKTDASSGEIAGIAEQAKKKTASIMRELDKIKNGTAKDLVQVNADLAKLTQQVVILSYLVTPNAETEPAQNGEKEFVSAENSITITRESENSYSIKLPLPQKGKRSAKSCEKGIAEILETKIEKFNREENRNGLVFDSATVTMQYCFGPEIPFGTIPDPDNIPVKGFLDSILMEFIKSDSILDIDLIMTGKRVKSESYMIIKIENGKRSDA